MGRSIGLALLLVLAFAVADLQAGILPPAIDNLARMNHRLHGTVIDHTHHHGADRRFWSQALCQKRDIYVYLPPCYDPSKQYPVMIWLHGFMQDENDFLTTFVIKFDRAIASGKIPPMIIAAPDGSSKQRFALFGPNSFFINSDAGRLRTTSSRTSGPSFFRTTRFARSARRIFWRESRWAASRPSTSP